jgi:hypothetical protein
MGLQSICSEWNFTIQLWLRNICWWTKQHGTCWCTTSRWQQQCCCETGGSSHKWDYIAFVLSGISGFNYDFEISAGEQSNMVPVGAPGLFASSNAVVRLVERVPSSNAVVRLVERVPRNRNSNFFVTGSPVLLLKYTWKKNERLLWV